MLSKALSHYPQFRFRDGQKRLWNPIIKKTFANLPEERVRLALIDYLTLEAGFSPHRISFESPVKLEGDKSSSRTDIICYDADFRPLLLVECKAPDIKLDVKAAIQVARYNQKVGAPFVLVSNGMLDFWFEIAEQKIHPKQEVPEIFQPKNDVDRKLTYWELRGFIGEKLYPEVRTFMVDSCLELFGDAHQPVKYVSFDDYSPEFSLGHYYRIFGMKDDQKLALSFAANPFGGTRFNAVLNQGGANTAFCSASVDLLAKGEFPNTEIHSGQGVHEANLLSKTAFNFKDSVTSLITEIRDLLLQYS
ncbi:MAG: type I restriction enzyme HsdR N-terminal domain-containing protein [Gracilimonas sp.]